MKHLALRGLGLVASLIALEGLAPGEDLGALQGPRCPSKVMAFYYPWYGAAPDYHHWATPTADPNYAHDPNVIVEVDGRYPEGKRRDIASANYPILGPYDSHDPAVIDQHLAWAEEAGIDVLVSSWWGPDYQYTDTGLRLLLDRIEATNSPVRAAVYLETWALFYGPQWDAGYFTQPRNFMLDSREEIRRRAADWIIDLLQRHGGRPGFERSQKGSRQVPVVFVYTAALFIPSEWDEIFTTVRNETGRDAFYQGDVEGVDFEAQAQIFDGLHVYMPGHLTSEGSLSFAARLNDPRANVKSPVADATDPVTLGGDYRAWAAEARALGKSWAATVIPAFDDRNVRNPGFLVSRDREHEKTYDFFWRESLATRPDWIVITSFNEWHEGSEIEPSVEHGDEYLTRTRLWTDFVRSCRERSS